MATRAASVVLPGVRGRSLRRRWDRIVPAIGLLLVLVSVTALGVALGRLPPRVTAQTEPRAPSLAALRLPESLDSIAGIEESSWPRSRYPVGGFAFVRCTNLWTAHADGSDARRILSMPGISSPTFSPDGRTIAFLATAVTGTDIWLTAADGSIVRRLGTVAEGGEPVLTHVGSLEWSPDGTRLAFSLMPAGLRGGTPTHWVLQLDAGMFEPVGEGGDEPVWLGRQILVAGRNDGAVERLWGPRWTAKRLSRIGDIQAVAFAPGWWAWEWEKQTALLIDDGAGSLSLAWQKGPYRTGSAFTTEPPPGYAFDPGARLAVLQHGTVAATLLDETGERDLGLFDPATREWTTMDYAWDAAGSPAPATLGSLDERRAVELVQSLLWEIDRDGRADLLLEAPLDPGLVPFRAVGFTLETARRANHAWMISAHAFGRTESGFATRDLRAIVRPVDGRLSITLQPTGAIETLRTVDDAVRYLDRLLTVRVLAPAGLPEDTRLAARAIDAWSWRGRATGSLHVIAPGLGRLTFYYGDSSFGCGAYPVPLALGTGTPAIIQDPKYADGFNAIAWPAGPKESSGPFGITGDAPSASLVAIATAMDAVRVEP